MISKVIQRLRFWWRGPLHTATDELQEATKALCNAADALDRSLDATARRINDAADKAQKNDRTHS